MAVLLLLLAESIALAYPAERNGSAEARGSGAVEAFARGGSVDSNSVAVLVTDLRSGEVLGEWNASKAMTPASVMKAVTTATLLEEVGRDWRYETKVWYTGRKNGRVLDGNIEVEASGDPSVNSGSLADNPDILSEIGEALRKAGIDTVRGRIIIDESRFAGPAINPGWSSGDLPHAYGTGTHGFNFEGNASGGKSVREPSQTFRSKLTSRLRGSGIVVQGRNVEASGRKLLVNHRSLPVEEIMRSCMMRSDNQFAEGMMRTVSERTGHDGSIAEGTVHTLEYWRKKGAPVKNVVIKDGSGLSRGNRLTARFLGSVLVSMSDDPYYASFFPLAGEEGTLRKFMHGAPLQGKVAMKTGSMNGIQSYAGYKLDDNYAPTHVIVVMINNMANRAAARAGVQKMLEELFL